MKFSDFLTISKLAIGIAGICLGTALIFWLLLVTKTVEGIGLPIFLMPALEGIACILVILVFCKELHRYHNK